MNGSKKRKKEDRDERKRGEQNEKIRIDYRVCSRREACNYVYSLSPGDVKIISRLKKKKYKKSYLHKM